MMQKAGLSVLKPDFAPSTLSMLGNYVAAKCTPKVLPISNDCTRQVTLLEMRTQARDKPWFIVDGEVYDGTGFLRDHPGGESSILLVAGEDASEDFRAIHSADARARLRQVSTWMIGFTIHEADTYNNGIPCLVSCRDTCPDQCARGPNTRVEGRTIVSFPLAASLGADHPYQL